MLSIFFTILLFISHSIHINAANPPSLVTILTTYSTTVSDRCHTIMASTAATGPVVTSITKTKTMSMPHRRQRSTSFATVTFIHRAPTTTSTVTSFINSTFTPPAYVSTYVTTITSRTTIVAMVTPPPVTISNLTTTITSTTVDVSTIPVPSGWYPIKDTQNQVFPRSPPFTNTSKREVQRRIPAGAPNLRAKLYPKSVLCVKNIKIFTSLTSVFAATKTITATPSLLVIYTTRTVTNVITLMQSTATTTLTMQTTEYTILSTTLPASTISSIDTSTLVISTSTNSYAACFTPNLLGPILPSSFPEAGNHITNVVFSQIGSQSVGTLAFDNAYDCCVACVTTDGCAYGAWSVDVDTFPQQEHKCFGLFIDGNGLCGKQSEQAGYFVSEPGQEGGYKMVVFNACGYVWDGGLDMN